MSRFETFESNKTNIRLGFSRKILYDISYNMKNEIKAIKAFLKEQNLSRFAKQNKINRAVLYDFLSGRNIRVDHFLKILEATPFHILPRDRSRFHLENIPLDQSKKEHFYRLLELIVEKYDPEKIILFGSQASGKWSRHSDFDLALVDTHIKNTGGQLLLWAFEHGIRITFDYFVMTNEWLQSEAKWINSLENAVLNEGHTIYERHQSSKESQR